MSNVTSLTLGHAASLSCSKNERDGLIGSHCARWPSPKDRVVSPTGLLPRASLVYFAYPPPGISLADIELFTPEPVGKEVLVYLPATGAPRFAIPAAGPCLCPKKESSTAFLAF
mmetsp:Transcript_20985/g.31824  ORF Transcript_20985/g.31824 Transcript_20985/m.31824 type:complete len:114 (+) Transcript_20985:931-1272(+)